MYFIFLQRLHSLKQEITGSTSAVSAAAAVQEGGGDNSPENGLSTEPSTSISMVSAATALEQEDNSLGDGLSNKPCRPICTTCLMRQSHVKTEMKHTMPRAVQAHPSVRSIGDHVSAIHIIAHIY